MATPHAPAHPHPRATSPRPITRRERAIGRVSLWCLLYLLRAAHRRGDQHEREHIAAALRAGDTSTRHVQPCIARHVLLVNYQPREDR